MNTVPQRLEAPQPGLLDSGGLRFSFLERGKGPGLVLLHGIGSAARSWRLQLAGIGGGCRAVAWDAPGYGRSSALPNAAPAAADYAAALAAFLDGIGLKRCHLVGHSLGALMAASFAASHRDRVLSLTLASVAQGHGRLPAERRERLLRDRLDDVATLGVAGMAAKRGPRLVAPGADEAVRRSVIEVMATLRPEGLNQAARMLSAGDIFADLKRLDPGLPARVVYGTEDIVTPPAANEAVAQAMPGARVHAIAGAGHAVYLERPEAFNAIIAEVVRT